MKNLRIKEVLGLSEVVVWGILVAATVLAWFLGHQQTGTAAVVAAIFLVAFVKIRLVGMYFMELRRAPTLLRGAFDAYLVISFVALTGFCLIA